MKEKKLTEDQIVSELMSWKLDYERDFRVALHCKHCMEEFRAGMFGTDDQSPRDAMNYELVSCGINLSDGGSIGVVSVWCKRCGRLVWDSRHLTHRY